MKLKYWFVARKRGVGWTPNTWQGWTVQGLYVLALIYSFFQIDQQSHSVSDTLINFVPRAFVLTAILIVITYLKGEPTSWEAGEKKEHNPHG